MTDAITRDNYADANARAIDGWNADGWEWGTPITHEDYLRACQGDWEMLLTPTKPVPHDWYPADMTGLRVLGLACGGAQQMPIFAALGAVCTVLDYTPSQLESERMVAQREGYEIEIVRADMSKPLPLEDASFDMIFHPVSNCYIEDSQAALARMQPHFETRRQAACRAGQRLWLRVRLPRRRASDLQSAVQSAG